MRKNRMMRAASALSIAVLLSTSMISGTFAKYVTSKTTSDTARVAKWGVEFTTSSDLFATSYAYDDSKFTAEGKVSVLSENASTNENDNVVAPGTKGDAYSFTTTGKPEVSYIVTFDAADDMETVKLMKNAAGTNISYYPVQFTLKIGDADVTFSSQSLEGIVAAIEGCSYYYDVTSSKYYYRTASDANWTEFTGTGAPSINLSWKWDFSNSSDNDTLDTILGNLAAGETISNITATDYNLEIKINVTATATQID